MGKEENTARRGRGRPRKQNFGAIKEVCTAPVIELTSSSDDDEPPPKPVTTVRKPPTVVKTASSKPPILGKRSLILKTPVQPTPKPVISEKVRKMTDTEELLSILENDEDELEGLPLMKEGRKPWESSQDKLERTKDILLKSIEDELRYLDEVEETRSKPAQKYLSSEVKTTSKEAAPKKISAKRSSVEIIDEIKTPCNDPVIKSVVETPKLGSDMVIRRVNNKPEKKVSFGSPLTIKDEIRRKFSDIKKVDETRKERTKVLSPSDVKLPPEVLEAIKKRSNLGRIEKIVEKTDANHKSKYIVIFNRGAGTTRKKGSIDEEIEALLKALPEKTAPKKQKSELREVIPKVKQPPKVRLPPRLPFHHTPSKPSLVEKSPVVTPTKPAEKKSPPPSATAAVPADAVTAAAAAVPAAAEKKAEEPVRFTESPLGNEPPLPWDTTRGDGFEKYFKTVERLVEHHDSLDSDSEYDEPQMFSHFKNDGRTDLQPDSKKRENDQINVSNIAVTMAKEFPGWSLESLAGSDTICLVRFGTDRRGISGPRKQIRIGADYNVSVIVNNTTIPEFEGMYDSFDNIKQLVREIDQL